MRIGRTDSGTEFTVEAMESKADLIKKIAILGSIDRFQIHCIAQYMAIRSKRKFGRDSSEAEWWLDVSEKIEESFEEGEAPSLKILFEIKTSIDMRNHGVQLVDTIFRED